ncbi:site-specific integrase [Cytobacillus sp. IB215665]|uniref:site-specific integrase n=1 Tax=Cytobacillus sp. IB215665 TaxID=3097357 RepID=UPI0039B779C8
MLNYYTDNGLSSKSHNFLGGFLLKAAIDDFILYIQIEKNYSSHTVVSYEYDLNQFLAWS